MITKKTNSIVIFSFIFSIIMFQAIFVNSTTNITSWGYQLQNFTIDELSSSNFDLLVIDYSFDGSDESRLTSSQVSQIQESGKLVVSYISIGEAEEYRYYFDENWVNNVNSRPSWLENENPDWPGNYKVKYWQNEWQSIIFEYIDKIIDSGFNGIYLDIIDAYEYFEDVRPSSADDMISFVSSISTYSKNNSVFGNEFLIIPQNGNALLQRKEYRDVIDGIGQEDVYITEEGEKRNNLEIKSIEENLDLLASNNKPVLVVDYTSDYELINFAQNSAKSKGYISYIGVLDLDKLVIQNFSSTQDSTILIIYPLIISFLFLITINIKKRRPSMFDS